MKEIMRREQWNRGVKPPKPPVKKEIDVDAVIKEVESSIIKDENVVQQKKLREQNQMGNGRLLICFG